MIKLAVQQRVIKENNSTCWGIYKFEDGVEIFWPVSMTPEKLFSYVGNTEGAQSFYRVHKTLFQKPIEQTTLVQTYEEPRIYLSSELITIEKVQLPMSIKETGCFPEV